MEKLILDKLNKIATKKVEMQSDIYNIGIDSLDIVELVTEAEETLDVTISDEELESIKSVKDVIDVFKKATK
ncbi:MAG: acyl carrier protein [Mycoplasmatales bacterium]|nr:acyl carrier protein [Mycoplasmatales bacterium]